MTDNLKTFVLYDALSHSFVSQLGCHSVWTDSYPAARKFSFSDAITKASEVIDMLDSNVRIMVVPSESAWVLDKKVNDDK